MIVQYSVCSKRRGSRDRDKTPQGPRPLLLVAFVRLPCGQLTVLGLLTRERGGLRYA
jgi:hypothetical protein